MEGILNAILEAISRGSILKPILEAILKTNLEYILKTLLMAISRGL